MHYNYIVHDEDRQAKEYQAYLEYMVRALDTLIQRVRDNQPSQGGHEMGNIALAGYIECLPRSEKPTSTGFMEFYCLILQSALNKLIANEACMDRYTCKGYDFNIFIMASDDIETCISITIQEPDSSLVQDAYDAIASRGSVVLTAENVEFHIPGS